MNSLCYKRYVWWNKGMLFRFSFKMWGKLHKIYQRVIKILMFCLGLSSKKYHSGKVRWTRQNLASLLLIHGTKKRSQAAAAANNSAVFNTSIWELRREDHEWIQSQAIIYGKYQNLQENPDGSKIATWVTRKTHDMWWFCITCSMRRKSVFTNKNLTPGGL